MRQEAVQVHALGEKDSAFYPNQVNHRPLTPISFLEWAATVHPSHVAVVDGQTVYDYAELYERSCRLAGALHAAGVEEGSVVGVMSPNTAMMIEAHYAIPMLGAVIATINPRRDVETLAYLLEHSEARVILADHSCQVRLNEAVAMLATPPLVVVAKPAKGKPAVKGKYYEDFLAGGSANFRGVGPRDEWQSIGLNYTQGTESAPKGVLYHHRGAYLDTLANVVSGGMGRDTVYLWTLPMFRAHGWCHVWSVAAVAGTQICLPSLDAAEDIMGLIKHHKVTHMGGKRGFLGWLAQRVKGKKLPHAVVLEVVDDDYSPADVEIVKKAGFQVSLLYGMTETYGPAAICEVDDEHAKGGLRAHASAHYPTLDRLELMHPETMKPVPADGTSVGEIMLRGNTVFKGYYKDAAATKRAFRGGMFHTGDMGVIHPDGHVEILSRAGSGKQGFAVPAWLEKLEAAAAERSIRAVALEVPSNRRRDEARYALFVHTGDGSAKTKKSWQSWLEEQLKENQLDQLSLHLLDNIPLTEDGDVMRYRLLDMLR
jgi:fatty-acyl-CoA synthase